MIRRLLGPVTGPVLFLLVAALVFAGLGWVTVASLRVEEANRMAAADAQQAANLRVALWRLDGRVLPVLGVEDSRPFHHYAGGEVPLVYGPGSAPLLDADLRWMRMHFQVDPQTGWSSPQVLGELEAERLKAAWPGLGLRNVTPDRAALLSDLRGRYAPDHAAALFAARERAIQTDPMASYPRPGPAAALRPDGVAPEQFQVYPPAALPPSANLPEPGSLPPVTTPPNPAANTVSENINPEYRTPYDRFKDGAKRYDSQQKEVPALAPDPKPVAPQSDVLANKPGEYPNRAAVGRDAVADARALSQQNQLLPTGGGGFGATYGYGPQVGGGLRNVPKNLAPGPVVQNTGPVGPNVIPVAPVAGPMPQSSPLPVPGPGPGGPGAGPVAAGLVPTNNIDKQTQERFRQNGPQNGFGGGLGGAGGGPLQARNNTLDGGNARRAGIEKEQQFRFAGPGWEPQKNGGTPKVVARAEKAVNGVEAAADGRLRVGQLPGGKLYDNFGAALKAREDRKFIFEAKDANENAFARKPNLAAPVLGRGAVPDPVAPPGPIADQPHGPPPAVIPPAAPVTVHLGAMRPQWLTAPDGTDVLVLVRAAVIDNQRTVYQGVVIDWPRLEALLLESLKDLYPDAKLVPIHDPAAASPERAMTALPVQLDPGPAPAAAPVGWTPLRFGLVLAWVAAVIAFAAVGFSGWSLLDLAERRIRFVSAVTHELRTPLTSLRLYLDLLLSGMVQDEEKRREYLATLNTESDRLHRLIDNVLDFARLESRRKAKDSQPVRVTELLDQLRLTWAERCGADDKELVVLSTLPPDEKVCTDPDLVHQIVGNLIDNARKYTRDASDKRIWVWAKPGGRGRVALEVEDRGAGVPKAERKLIFRPFRRGGTADTRAGGAGLGLALARQWAELLGGRLTYRPADGGVGACFRLELRSA